MKLTINLTSYTDALSYRYPNRKVIVKPLFSDLITKELILEVILIRYVNKDFLDNVEDVSPTLQRLKTNRARTKGLLITSLILGNNTLNVLSHSTKNLDLLWQNQE